MSLDCLSRLQACHQLTVPFENLDVFVNGTISVRHVMSSPPKQNYGDVFINMNNGFSGLLLPKW